MSYPFRLLSNISELLILQRLEDSLTYFSLGCNYFILFTLVRFIDDNFSQEFISRNHTLVCFMCKHVLTSYTQIYFGLEETFSQVDLLLQQVSRDLSHNNSQIANQTREMIVVPYAIRRHAKLFQFEEVLKITLLGKRLTKASDGGRGS